jgi:class 3 adenylate cyclase
MARTRKTVTVLFADVAGSTALGEALDPEVVRGVMERFIDEARSAIEHHGGTVEKFAGDAVMAVFGVPVIHEDDALRAVRAASEMRERLAVLNAELGRERGLALALRTGVNTGEVVAGDPSSGEFYATGDAVNVAARLEQAAAPGEILLGEPTYRLVRDSVQAEVVEPLVLKGKAAAVPAYRLGLIDEEAAPVFRFDSPFVGRSAELARLRGAFGRAIAERAPLLVTVLGPAGIGKTRLAAELTSTLDDQANVLQGRCLSYGEGITFWPLQEIVRSLPELPEGLLDPEQARSTEETFWAYRKLVERLAGERPLVLVLEDIHWAEPTLLELLEHVVEWTRDVPILLLCLARPELLDERPGWPGERVELEPLGEHEVEALLSELSDELAIEERVRISEATEGNPLFAEQMVALALEEGGGEADVPPTIHALLAARIDRLQVDERAVFERAAVVGKEFWRGALLELSPPGTEVSAILQRLVRRRLITPERSTVSGEDAFRFAHVLVRDAGYSAIPKERRADLHERLAGWLERNQRAYAEIVGYHLEQAYRYRAELGPVGDAERELAARAGAALAKAGLAVQRRGDATGAVNLLSRALDLLPVDALVRAELLLALGYSLAASDMREAAAVYEAARAAAEAAGDRNLAWVATLERNFIQVALRGTSRSFDDLLIEAEQAVAGLEELGDKRALAQAWRAVARCRNILGRSAASAQAFERGAAFAQQAGDWPSERLCLMGITESLLTGPAPASEGIRWCEEILGRRDDIFVRCAMRNRLSEFHAMLGHAEQAQHLRELALADAEGFGLKRQFASFGIPSRSFVELLGSTEAERGLRRSLALWEEMGVEAAVSTAAAVLAQILVASRRYEEAEQYVAFDDSVASVEDYEARSLARTVRARVLAERGELERAESLARQAMAIADPTDNIDLRAWIRVDLAEVLSIATKNDEARSVLEEAVRLGEQKEDVILVERAQARLAELQEPAPR